mmetsp:Transcript_10817/g.27837  ORF Transcript_10817/g.27837 Transcript_10817/m.27837 type:complete len:277 (+) Transcript_10817:302-1132(+)
MVYRTHHLWLRDEPLLQRVHRRPRQHERRAKQHLVHVQVGLVDVVHGLHVPDSPLKIRLFSGPDEERLFFPSHPFERRDNVPRLVGLHVQIVDNIQIPLSILDRETHPKSKGLHLLRELNPMIARSGAVHHPTSAPYGTSDRSVSCSPRPLLLPRLLATSPHFRPRLGFRRPLPPLPALVHDRAVQQVDPRRHGKKFAWKLLDATPGKERRRGLGVLFRGLRDLVLERPCLDHPRRRVLFRYRLQPPSCHSCRATHRLHSRPTRRRGTDRRPPDPS